MIQTQIQRQHPPSGSSLVWHAQVGVSFQPSQWSFSSPACPLWPLPAWGSPSYWHFWQGVAVPSTDPHDALPQHLLHCLLSCASPHAQRVSSSSVSSRLATFPGPITLGPHAHSAEHVPVILQLLLPVPKLPDVLTSPDAWKHPLWGLPAGLWWHLQQIPRGKISYLCLSETSSQGQEMTDFLAKNSQEHLSKEKKRESISLTYISGFLACDWPCSSPVTRLKAEELLQRQKSILCDLIRLRALDVAGV